MTIQEAVHPDPEPRAGIGRRRFLGYVLAAPVLTVAARWTLDTPAARAATPTGGVPSGPQLSDTVDLNDLLTDATLPTANLITVVVNTDGTASFALPRAESGQGITTSSAMLIAEELDLPLDKIIMTLADARPELVFNQFTAGSNTTISTYTPIRVAAALARQRLLEAAAVELGDEVTNLRTSLGSVISSTGRSVSYGALAAQAASATVQAQAVTLKDPSDFTVIGTPQNRIDALAAVTGQKQYAMDLDVAGALPTMVCRAPTLNGTVQAVRNSAQVKGMPGITDVAVIPTGVAVRGATFGQVIDAVRALDVSWGPGNVDGESDGTVLAALQAAELPMAVPKVPALATTLDARFTFYWRSNSALEPQTAVADVRAGSAEVWSAMQSPILTQQTVATALGLPVSAVTAHVVQAGGAFGRRMFSNVVVEAAQISKAVGKPVKLMWDRTAEFRYGRVHPMCTSRVRATVLGGNVLSFEQRHTSVATDYTQGFGEILSSTAGKLPEGDFLGYSQTVFETTTNVPYNVGVVSQLLNEIFQYDTFHSGSVRNLYNPEVVTAVELMVDQIARVVGKDPYALRRSLVKDPRAGAVLDAVAKAGAWGRSMPANTAQGIAIHTEYKGATACLVELDNTPATVRRTIRDAVTGPRVTKVVFAIDAGLPINPRGLEAQMMGGVNSAIGQVLTESLHLQDGHFLEGSWDNYFYTRQWNAPPDLQVIVMPPTTGEPGGAGEFGVAAAKAAVACAYARATGSLPTSFPVNHDGPLAFTPYPTVPSMPQSPTDGLDHAY
ncbi:MAG TPA: molybdopterin cofactor-binding domain-containing protein [Mycobacteriales bacterium]